MAKSKARYTGINSIGPAPKDFSHKLRNSLNAFYSGPGDPELDVLWDPSETFTNELLAEAGRAASMLHYMESDITVEELRIEHRDLLEALRSTESKLRTISPDLDRLISIDAEPGACADQIKQMIHYLEGTGPQLIKLPRAMRAEQKKRPIAIGMTERLLSVLKKYGIEPTAWVNEVDKKKTSKTIQMLKLIGDEIGLEYDQHTWRRFVKEALKNNKENKGDN